MSPFESFVFHTTIGQWLFALVLVAFLMLLGRVLLKLSSFAHAAADKAVAEHRSTSQVMFLRAADVIAKCASDAVLNIEQTLRPTIIGAAKDGKLDEAQAKYLRDQAVELAKKQAMGLFGKALEQIGVSSIEAFVPNIEHAIDASVERLAGSSRDYGNVAVPAAPGPQTPAQA